MKQGRIRLVVFDLDGTLVRGDTVCEAIARHIGKLARMRELEAYPWSKVTEARDEMASWYRERTLEDLLQGVSQVRLVPGAAEGIAWLRRRGVEVAIASVTWEFGVRWVAERLQVRHWLGTGLSPEGAITHVMPADKPRWAAELRSRLGLRAGEMAAVGDSGGDIPLLRSVGRAYFVGEDVPDVLTGHAVHRPGADIGKLVRELVADGG